ARRRGRVGLRAAGAIAARRADEGAEVAGRAPAERREIAHRIVAEVERARNARQVICDPAGAAGARHLLVVRVTQAALNIERVGEVEGQVTETRNLFVARGRRRLDELVERRGAARAIGLMCKDG